MMMTMKKKKKEERTGKNQDKLEVGGRRMLEEQEQRGINDVDPR